RRPADPPTRRPADPPTRRPACARSAPPDLDTRAARLGASRSWCLQSQVGELGPTLRSTTEDTAAGGETATASEAASAKDVTSAVRQLSH
ncbi:MAG: hypothetical protein V3V08_06075, partial [Nannocystaceae bacterium]